MIRPSDILAPMRVVVGLVVCAVGCGRIGFGEVGGRVDGDAAVDAESFDSGVCATALRSGIDPMGSPAGDWVTGVVGRPSLDGFTLTYVAPDGIAYGSTYGMSSTITTGVVDKNLNAGPVTAIGTISVGSSSYLLATSIAASTSIIPLDPALVASGAGTVLPNKTAIDVPLAAIVATTGGLFAMAFHANGSTAINAAITTSSGMVGSPAPLVAGTENASGAAIVGAGTNFLVTWISGGTARAEVVDSNLATVVAPASFSGGLTIGGTAFVRGSWAADPAVYAITWEQNGAIFAEITDASFVPIKNAFMISAAGTKPKIATDGHSFWIAWTDQTVASRLSVTHLLSDGVFATGRVDGSGGTLIDDNFIENGTTVQLAWVERGGDAGGDLWIIPACNL